MGARINNAPAYVVYDQTYSGVFTYTATANGINGGSYTGTPNLAIDKDLTTYFGVTISGASPTVATFTYDFGRVLWNNSLYVKHTLTCQVSGGETRAFSYSSDGSNWTDLETTDQNTITKNYQIMNLRYLRWTATQPAGGTIVINLYEVKLMGS